VEAGIGNAEAMDRLVGGLMDSAWAQYEPNVPAEYLEEFQGIADGMDDAGARYADNDSILLPIRLITLIDLAMSSQLDIDNLSAITSFLDTGYSDALRDYYGLRAPPPNPEVVRILRAAREMGAKGSLTGAPLSCSYFAAWGDRTDDGGMYATRNMDFSSDTGVSEFASVAIFVPDGGVPYASVSWVGANLGLLGGISQEGLTVSAVGASSPYERIATEPALLRAREALETATTIDEALPYLDNSVGDEIVRAPTIGYNALVTWGDPRGGGADAQAVILENNGLSSGVFHHHNDCSASPSLLRYDVAGVPTTYTPSDLPTLVNTEGEAKEIDGDGKVRLFSHDGADYLLDAYGHYIEDPTGLPIQTGYPEDCALYRGDEAMAYGVRQHQAACNGPGNGGDGLMIEGGSYRYRYLPMRDMTLAYAQGTAFSWEDQEVIPDNGGTPVLIGLDEIEAISRVAAMDSNVWDVVYDATDLEIRVSFESGTGESWTPAHEQPPFLHLDLDDLFLTD
jgi:hypothetical protein